MNYVKLFLWKYFSPFIVVFLVHSIITIPFYFYSQHTNSIKYYLLGFYLSITIGAIFMFFFGNKVIGGARYLIFERVNSSQYEEEDIEKVINFKDKKSFQKSYTLWIFGLYFLSILFTRGYTILYPNEQIQALLDVLIAAFATFIAFEKAYKYKFQ
jgi:hypothetical protein